MSKPREYLIDLLDCGIAKEITDPNVKESIHVIEKSAADKLAEALEFIHGHSTLSDKGRNDLIEQALKQYRSINEKNN